MRDYSNCPTKKDIFINEYSVVLRDLDWKSDVVVHGFWTRERRMVARKTNKALPRSYTTTGTFVP